MLNTLKEVLANQFHAALCTLGECIDRCPDAGWPAKVGHSDFNQSAPHTLNYASSKLGRRFVEQLVARTHPQHSPDFAIAPTGFAG